MNSMLPRKRFTFHDFDSTVGTSDSVRVSKTSLRDQAALLLSIADIAQSEITTCPSALSDDSSFPPCFPSLDGTTHMKCLTPRKDSLRGLLYSANSKPGPSRLRAVSIDTSSMDIVGNRHTPSPLESPPILPLGLVGGSCLSPIVGRLSHKSARLSHKARHDRVSEREDTKCEQVSPTFSTPSKSKALQGKPPAGVTIKKILRRKFSWKNYPEVRLDFLGEFL